MPGPQPNFQFYQNETGSCGKKQGLGPTACALTKCGYCDAVNCKATYLGSSSVSPCLDIDLEPNLPWLLLAYHFMYSHFSFKFLIQTCFCSIGGVSEAFLAFLSFPFTSPS